MNINRCGDKGISIGEKSVVTGRDMTIKRSGSGVVVKDSSRFYPNGKIDFQNVRPCFETYQKKQHYDNGLIHTKGLLDCPVNRFFNKVNLLEDPSDFCEEVSFISNIEICLKKNVIALKRIYATSPNRQVALAGPTGDPYLNLAFDRNRNRKCFNDGKCTLNIPLTFVKEVECRNSSAIDLFLGDHVAGKGFFDFDWMRIPCD